MKKLSSLVLLTTMMFSIITIAWCGNNQETENTTEIQTSTMSSALKFHIQTAADDLTNAIKDIDPTNFEANIGFVKYAQITIPQAKQLAEQEGNNEIAQKLQELDDRITAVTTNSWVLVSDFVVEVRFVSDLLKELIK